MLIDVGVNLTNDRFRKDRDEVIARARQAGVHPLIVTGTDLATTKRAIDLARQRPGALYATAGVHPHDAARAPEDFIDQLRELASDAVVRAIGECGLDYDRDYSPRPRQAEVFEAQVALATELDKPLFLHQRGAHHSLLGVLDRYDHPPACIHCFTGTAEELDDYVRRDLYVGITGWVCDERRGHGLHALLPKIPGDRLLLETDAPYLLPRDLRPKPRRGRNEPAFLPHINRAVAQHRGVAPEDQAFQTQENAKHFFRIE